MSEHNYAGLAFKDQLEQHPEVFDLTGLTEKINATTKAAHERHAANDLARDTKRGINTPRAIYNKLRKELFDLQEQARGAGTRLNNAAADEREFQSRVEALLIRKKKAVVDGALGEERCIERGLLAQENELLDSRERLLALQRDNQRAVRALKDWEAAHGAQLADLQKIVG
jgi:hypothetical protein